MTMMMMTWTSFDNGEIHLIIGISVFYPFYSYLTCHEIEEALLLHSEDAIFLLL